MNDVICVINICLLLAILAAPFVLLVWAVYRRISRGMAAK